MRKFPFYQQAEEKDCGPTCIRIISKHYGKNVPIQELRIHSETTREGSSLLGLSDASEKIGYRSIGVRLSLQQLSKAPLPCILHWRKTHFVVLYRIKKDTFYVSDPSHGLINYGKKEFLKNWIGNNAEASLKEGIALILEPTPKFYSQKYNDDPERQRYSFGYVSRYLLRYRKFLIQLVIGLMAGSLLQVLVPFLTQSIVDVGIKNQDIHFVYLVLFAQIALFTGKILLEIIRGWILLHLSTRINISLISDFFIKLTRLPISFFDVRMTGDILQRIQDHQRIEKIMTTSSLSVLFSLLNLVAFSFVLAYYSLLIFAIFVIGSFLYFGWIVIFLKKRKELDYKRFIELAKEQSKVIELINGMQEIKLHNAEKQKRWGWEYIQARLFRVSIKNLTLEQSQTVGSSFITELTNVCITVLSAKLVIDGSITLGMMLAISYIIGQLNGPIQQLIHFIRELQDAKISLDRLGEIHNKKEEEEEVGNQAIHQVPDEATLKITNVSFRYPGTDAPVLKDLTLEIPANKVTAIVGASGSGKTTLMKLLLNFYTPDSGHIFLDHHELKNLSQKQWRAKCGVVMQEGYIFNDTIANNIAIGQDDIDQERLLHAVDIANIKEFIESLPVGYNTEIGMEGLGMSTGQKQRLLIARAVYKNPKFLFFDEATSALDANNEKAIMGKLNTFFNNRTGVVIAHRLSTVKNAHQIVVLEKGKIIEVGNHKELTGKKGSYYRLVKNQLELGT